MADLLSLNALGPMRVNKAVLPAMRARRAGLIVWITSTLGRVLPGRGGLYPATKWAAEGLAETLHHQVAPFGIDVAILEPARFPPPRRLSRSWRTTSRSRRSTRHLDCRPTDQLASHPPPTTSRRTPRKWPMRCSGSSTCRRASDRCGPSWVRSLPRVSPNTTGPTSSCAQTWRSALRRPDQAITWTRAADPPRP